MSSAAPATSANRKHLFRDILQGSGIYLAGFIAQRFAGVLMLPITTRFLSTADFGIADLIEQTTSVISLLLGARLGAALGYFYFQKDSAQARRPIVATSLLGAVLLGILATTLCLPFATPIARMVFRDASASRYLWIVLPLLPLSFASDAAYGLLRVENRPVAYTLMSSLRLVLQMAGTITFVALLKLRVMGLCYSSLIATVLVAGMLAAHCLRRFGAHFEWGMFVRMMKYSMPLGLGGVAMFVLNVGDRFILPHYRSMSDLGIYVLAYKIGMLLAFVYASFQTYWSAQVFPIMRRPDAGHVFARTFTYVLTGISFSAIFLVVCSPSALHIMVAPSFWGAAALVPVIVAAYFFRAIGDFMRCLFLVEDRPGYDAICNWIGAAVCLAGYLLLIPKYGIWGAAYATLGAFVLLAGISVVWTYRVRPYQIETARLLKLGAACTAAMTPYYVLGHATLALSVGSGILSLALFPAMLWMLQFPTEGEWMLARTGWGKVRERLSRA